MEHKGWYTRGYLPRLDSAGAVQFVTFRLADSLPRQAIERMLDRQSSEDTQRLQHLEALLDVGYGSCLLRSTATAGLVQETMLRFHGLRYYLFAWCIMPNHVHGLLQPLEGYHLPAIMHSWKSYTAKRINSLCQRSGSLWQSESFDRYIRDERHLLGTIEYIENNPVKAGLVDAPHQWPWSSACHAPR